MKAIPLTFPSSHLYFYFCFMFFSSSRFSFDWKNVFSVPLVIKAHDIDAGLNSQLHYDIVEMMPRRYFHIDSTTGAIKTVMLLDHEKIPLFTFHVKVNIVSCLLMYELSSASQILCARVSLRGKMVGPGSVFSLPIDSPCPTVRCTESVAVGRFVCESTVSAHRPAMLSRSACSVCVHFHDNAICFTLQSFVWFPTPYSVHT